jgi:hypothetical protein
VADLALDVVDFFVCGKDPSSRSPGNRDHPVGIGAEDVELDAAIRPLFPVFRELPM